MSKKIEIIANALVVTDTVTSEVIVDVPKGQYYFDTDKLYDNGFIVFYDIDFLDNVAERPRLMLLSEAVDSTLTPFTESTFEDFCRQNLI